MMEILEIFYNKSSDIYNLFIRHITNGQLQGMYSAKLHSTAFEKFVKYNYLKIRFYPCAITFINDISQCSASLAQISSIPSEIGTDRRFYFKHSDGYFKQPTDTMSIKVVYHNDKLYFEYSNKIITTSLAFTPYAIDTLNDNIYAFHESGLNLPICEYVDKLPKNSNTIPSYSIPGGIFIERLTPGHISLKQKSNIIKRVILPTGVVVLNIGPVGEYEDIDLQFNDGKFIGIVADDKEYFAESLSEFGIKLDISPTYVATVTIE